MHPNTPYFPPTPQIAHLQLHTSPTAVYSITKPPAAKRIQSIILAQLRRQKLIPSTHTTSRRRPTHSHTSRHPPLPLTVTDATACAGGDTLHFAALFQRVHAIECGDTHVKMLRNNVRMYPDRSARVTVHHGDALKILPTLKQEVVFFDPPWGGKSYTAHRKLELTLSGRSLPEVVEQLWADRKRAGTRCVVFKMPRNAWFGAFRRGVMGRVGTGATTGTRRSRITPRTRVGAKGRVTVRRVDLARDRMALFVVGW